MSAEQKSGRLSEVNLGPYFNSEEAQQVVASLLSERDRLRADLAEERAKHALTLADRDEGVTEEVRLREALAFYANPETYKPHPNGLAFDNRDLSFRARTALGGDHV